MISNVLQKYINTGIFLFSFLLFTDNAYAGNIGITCDSSVKNKVRTLKELMTDEFSVASEPVCFYGSLNKDGYFSQNYIAIFGIEGLGHGNRSMQYMVLFSRIRTVSNEKNDIGGKIVLLDFKTVGYWGGPLLNVESAKMEDENLVVKGKQLIDCCHGKDVFFRFKFDRGMITYAAE